MNAIRDLPIGADEATEFDLGGPPGLAFTPLDMAWNLLRRKCAFEGCGIDARVAGTRQALAVVEEWVRLDGVGGFLGVQCIEFHSLTDSGEPRGWEYGGEERSAKLDSLKAQSIRYGYQIGGNSLQDREIEIFF